MRELASEREKLRVVGGSVSEWETESKRESSGEGDREGRLLYSYNRRTQLLLLTKA